MRHIVIVGNGIAGLTAADTLRRLDFDGEMTLVGEEDRPTYSRPALSKTALDPNQEFQVSYLPEATHAGTQLLGTTAVALDTQQQRLTLHDCNTLGYDGLIIATGTSARRFSTSDREFTVRSVDDAIALRNRLATRPSVTVIGGGVLGMELASGANAMGCDVTLIHCGTPMTDHIGPLLASLISQVAIEHGLRLIDGRVNAVDELSTGMAVQLADGQQVSSDIVISAIGDAPNIQWLAQAGLLHDGRLVIDRQCRVQDNIVAAGDVAWLKTPEGPQRYPVWTSAIEQAKIAAASLLNPQDATQLNFQPYFWTDQWGMNLKISGPARLPETAPVVVRGSLEERAAVLHWPEYGAAAAWNLRMSLPKLHKLARETVVSA
ncbi:NAD(P)/FAD-dependent oxidoreductase [Enteractinococcus helveticum]|uniref:Pyridine nucleotide-disulfide oxidoreductase n=1 Tax=Enteractinococcus helveticum TaxID=1837282 RepID=A0A1B7M141_9MICC|nr:FAD-dependent oxidoreductase [Enteractinococcus helveticum]OAV62137.1 pyridine nucleotide-disulfide oxidoreductase [Enteractinococcus helveticum]